MPRNINPDDIKSGPGKQVPGDTTLTLGGAGMVGPGPNIGEAEGVPPFGPGEGGGGSDAALKAHINSGHAHSATAIWTQEGPSTLPSGDVEGELDELAGALPPEPPRLGYTHTYLTFSGIPDWGELKMRDSPLQETIPLTTPNDASDIFPYYYETPTPTQDPEFAMRGNDPQSDWTFNSSQTPGAGPGEAAAGGFTRPAAGPSPSPVIRTTSILERGGSAQEIIVSGSVYPADRGVLAFMHWPAGGDISDFLAQPLLDRCLCAILLGHGILGEAPCEGGACDGGIGGIFDPGEDANGEYDPFAYPGQAGGQYDLHEIATGLSDIDGSVLKAPWDDKDGDGNPGWQRDLNSVLPGPGQVRLGTDPDVGVTPEPYGIPILGGDIDCYDTGTPPASPLGNIGIIPTDVWFFRYRLPYLDDYSQATGLKWTPGGISGTETTAKEKARYFDVPLGSGVPVLTQAGDYADFPGDNYTWQVARFRFGFNMKYTGGATDYEEHGTYFFIHFKREQDFEAFVVNGTMPEDVTDGYEIYSARPAFLPDPSIEDTGNRVNEETSTAVFAPNGPAPTYGYKAWPYHVMKVNVYEDPYAYDVVPGDIVTKDSTFVPNGGTMFVSGIEYYVPRNFATGLPSTYLSTVINVSNFWQYSYRTDDRALSGALGDTPPALLSTPNPVFLGVAPFAYETTGYTLITGAAGTRYTASAYYLRKHRVEIPYTHLDGVGSFSETDGPLSTDALQIAGGSYPQLTFSGDVDTPSFTADARFRVYLRRPRGNTEKNANHGVVPYDTIDGPGILTTDTWPGAPKYLYHSTSFEFINLVGHYGNFMQGGITNPAYPQMVTTLKDTEERFLDEIYRYANQFPFGIDATFGAGAAASLNGPGLGAWVPAPIETPVRVASIFPTALWASGSYVRQGIEQLALANGGPTIWYAQVAGLPDRNPRIAVGAQVPFPSSGILLYPHKDYSSAYRPVGADYSSLTGIRHYIRCFDASFNDTRSAAGQPFVTLRIDGLQLQDYEYTAPGPGTLASTEGIAIFVKVPGLTTWMDIGRPDGAGPSKQDANLDGAGCKVIGPETFDGVDDETQYVYSQVKVNVGPAINLFKNTGVDGVTAGYVPVLVKVEMDTQAAAFNLEEEYDPITRTFSGTPAPGTDSTLVRGLLGIKIV